MNDRQSRTGWILVIVSAAVILYFIKVRLLTDGPVLEKREWLQFIGVVVTLMIGVMNVRLAARRAEAQAAQRTKQPPATGRRPAGTVSNSERNPR